MLGGITQPKMKGAVISMKHKAKNPNTLTNKCRKTMQILAAVHKNQNKQAEAVNSRISEMVHSSQIVV